MTLPIGYYLARIRGDLGIRHNPSHRILERSLAERADNCHTSPKYPSPPVDMGGCFGGLDAYWMAIAIRSRSSGVM